MKNAALILDLLISAATRFSELTELLKLAHTEGRDVSDAELDAFASRDDDARKRLQDLIDQKKGGV